MLPTGSTPAWQWPRGSSSGPDIFQELPSTEKAAVETGALTAQKCEESLREEDCPQILPNRCAEIKLRAERGAGEMLAGSSFRLPETPLSFPSFALIAAKFFQLAPLFPHELTSGSYINPNSGNDSSLSGIIDRNTDVCGVPVSAKQPAASRDTQPRPAWLGR